MSHSALELAELVDQFCEGDIGREDAARLEALIAESDEARQHLLDCFQIHCELAWEFRRSCENRIEGDSVMPLPDPRQVQSERNGFYGWKLSALAVGLLLAVTLGLLGVFRKGGQGTESRPASIARIEQVNDVHWRGTTSAIDSPLAVGDKLAIQQGLLQVAFQSGAKIILQGPAEVEFKSPSSAILSHGRLTADVSAAARGFTISTPNATVVDLGTRFSVSFQTGQTDVEVFLGKVLVRLVDSQSKGGVRDLPLSADSAIRVSGKPGEGDLKIEPLVAGSSHFVQSLAGSVAQLQSVVENDPQLIHLFPFEGATLAERLRDRRGKLDLHEVTMRDGDGGGLLKFAHAGPDPSAQVLASYRAEPYWGALGRGLQSATVFQPPASMSVELLLNLARIDWNQEGVIAGAVTTRPDRDHCGFLVTVIRNGELAFLLKGNSEWLQSGFQFTPGRWYFVANTFRSKNAETEVNSYVADLSENGPKLKWVVQNQVVPGLPAAGSLGIGMGFDGQKAGAYPWAGQLGQVAIYDTLLDRQTLENHLRALSPGTVRPSESATPVPSIP